MIRWTRTRKIATAEPGRRVPSPAARAPIGVFSYYQPADRYWIFQSIETAVFLGLSLVLVLVTVWFVRRRA